MKIIRLTSHESGKQVWLADIWIVALYPNEYFTLVECGDDSMVKVKETPQEISRLCNDIA